MDSILFLMVMIAMGWVIIWYCADHSKPSRTWWPFAIRENDGAGREPEANPHVVGARRVPTIETRPWRQSSPR
jgi:hypothetical protein